MTGPEHYRLAESFLARAPSPTPAEVARAQVHSILALAAATALSGITLTLPDGSGLAVDWNSAILEDWKFTPPLDYPPRG